MINWIFFPRLNWIFAGYTGSNNPDQTWQKNQIRQTGNFKLENFKNQVQVHRGIVMDMLMPHALLSTISEKLQACLTSLAWQFVQWNYKENNRQDLNAKYILNTEGAPEWSSPLSHDLTPKKFSLLARFCLYKEREAVFVRVMTLVVLK